MIEGRTTELEIKVAYQEDLLQALNEIVSEQQKQIFRLEETCKYLNEQMKSRGVSQEVEQGIEQPPHY